MIPDYRDLLSPCLFAGEASANWSAYVTEIYDISKITADYFDVVDNGMCARACVRACVC